MSDFKAGSLSQVLEDLIQKHGIVDIITVIECLAGDTKAELAADGHRIESRRWHTLGTKLKAAAIYAQDHKL